MPLSDALRRTLPVADASSFRLAGEELWLVTGADLRRAADEWSLALERVPPALRPRLEDEHLGLARAAHHWLSTFNGNLEARLRGYAAIGRTFAWELPWPAVAILGVLRVKGGVRQSEAIRLAGLAAAEVGEIGDWIQDVLRRTNRGIFADSVPCALWALRAASLRASGDADLARALLEGPLPPAMDEESRRIARGIDAALQLEDGAQRFDALAAVTLQQFDREQAVFTAQMGAHREGDGPEWNGLRRFLTRLSRVDAPVVENGRLRSRSYRFPSSFDVRDHRARSEHFARAFVTSVTGSAADFRVAVGEVIRRLPPGSPPAYADGRPALPPWAAVATASL
ncbi:MAG: hypothetical protein JNK82_38480 [Myxococcaceae bacterium]|nr:hypothetical protein [Myxococcaceae bacterium]